MADVLRAGLLIHTQRLTLRPLCSADLADLQAVNGDPEVTRFLPYEAWSDAQDGPAWLARMQALAQGGSATQLVLHHREQARTIGTVLLFKLDETSRRVELGYVLGRAHWRQGYMHEALGALCAHVFDAMGLRRIEAEVNPDNTASCLLLQSLGFVCEGTARQRWFAKGRAYDTRLYGLLASDARPKPLTA